MNDRRSLAARDASSRGNMDVWEGGTQRLLALLRSATEVLLQIWAQRNACTVNCVPRPNPNPPVTKTLPAVLLIAVATTVGAQSIKLTIDPKSKLTILGTSNVHKWDCSTSTLRSTIEAPRAAAPNVGKEVTHGKVTIPVASLDCGEKKMNENLRKAMDAEKFPNVEFEMTSYTAAAVAKTASVYEASIRGSLTIHGVTKPVEIKATVTPDGNGGVRLEGSTEVRTPDYGVERVKAMLGTIRTGETVTIVLSLIANQP